MESPPEPVQLPPPDVSQPAPAARPGGLTPGWRVTTVAAWFGVLIAWSCVWKASRELGLATWWLGPESRPRPIVVTLLPFAGPAAMVVAALGNVRRLPWSGLLASAVLAVMAVPDLHRVRRLGIVELTIAGAAAAISLASLAGVYRRAPSPTGTTAGGRRPAPPRAPATTTGGQA